MKTISALGVLVTVLGLSASGCADPDDGPEAATSADPLSTGSTFFAPKPVKAGGHLNAYARIGDYSAADLNAVQQVDGYAAFGLARPAVCGVTLYEMSFTTTPPNGQEPTANATAAVLVPSGSDGRCTTPRPLVVVAQGTQVDTSARAADPTSWGTRLFGAYHAAQGFTVVIPDYLGNGDPSRLPGFPKYAYHPYLHAQTEATTLLDAIRAVRSSGLPLAGRKVAFVGASQGAHGAASAHVATERLYPGELDVVGTSLAAGVLDVPGTIASWRATAGDRQSPTAPSAGLLLGKATSAWARLAGASSLTATQVTDAARANDIVGIVNLGAPRVPVQLCGYEGDALVPFAGTTALATKLGAGARPVIRLGGAEIDRGRRTLRSLDQPGIASHLVAATVCSVKSLDYLKEVAR